MLSKAISLFFLTICLLLATGATADSDTIPVFVTLR